jgi:hypothetical protein
MASVTPAMVCQGALTKSPTGVTKAGSRRASATARSIVTWRGLFS